MLKQRIITALILAPLVVWGIFGLHTLHFALFIGAIVTLAGWEWGNLAGWTSQPGRWGYAAIIALLLVLSYRIAPAVILLPALVWWLGAFALVATYPASAARWDAPWVRGVMGVLVLVPAWKGLVLLHDAQWLLGESLDGVWIILYVFCTVWAADIGAYFAGRAWGNKKLAPNVSPGKSWAGVYGGLAAVTLLALLCGVALHLALQQGLLLIVVSLVTAAVSVVGDLNESMLKRHRGIKDSSQLLPGHGGILDRIDSITAAVPLFAVAAVWLGWIS